MERAGWKNELINKLTNAYISHSAISNSRDYKANANDIKSVAFIIEAIGKSKDVNVIIDAERMMLRHETEFYGKNNLQALKSLNEAIKELDGATKALDIVKDKHLYQAVNAAHSPKDRDRKNGFPKDAFHTFTNSHKTRLGNRLRSIEASFEERLLLKERYNNMQIVQKEYMKLQSKALDIPMPEKTRKRGK